MKACHNFQYLGALIRCAENLTAGHKALALAATCTVRPTFDTNTSDGIKRGLFNAPCQISLDGISITSVSKSPDYLATLSSDIWRRLGISEFQAIIRHYP